MNDRTFSDQQIQALLERAAQLQGDSQRLPDAGLTLAELEQVAAESGIDRVFLRAALREADAGVGFRNVAGQTKTHVFVERTVPGTLSEDEWEAVVLRLRDRFSSDLAMSFGMGPQYGTGVVEQLGRTRTWRHTTTMGISTTATIRSAEGAQHIRIQRRVGLARPLVEGIGYGTILALVSGGLAGGIAESALAFVLVFAVVLLLGSVSIAVLDRMWRDRKQAELEEELEAIAQIIHDAPETDAVPDRVPALDLDALPEAPEASALDPARHQTRS